MTTLRHYTTAAGARALVAQTIDGRTALADVPIGDRGRVYLVERDIDDASELRAIAAEYHGAMQAQARRLVEAWLRGVGGFPGFEAMFRVSVATGQALKSLPVVADLADLSAAAGAYRQAITAWAAQQREIDPLLALVLVPHSERWQTDRPYYEAKAAFANLGIPSQMVTTELIADEGRSLSSSRRSYLWGACSGVRLSSCGHEPRARHDGRPCPGSHGFGAYGSAVRWRLAPGASPASAISRRTCVAAPA